ncbi:MAG: hypothetical protein ABIT38_20685, partial [Gemmatimonadaceae bacterium]
MPSNVFVALWSNNNVASRSWTTTITARVHRLDRRLELAQQWINSRAAQLNTNLPYQGIFLAPEYLFTKQSATNERNPMSESRRLRLEQSFLGLSRKYPKILIVPGTVFYAKR